MITIHKKRLRSGLYGRHFNTYFSDNMGNLTTVGSQSPQARTQLNGYSIGTSETWLYRGYFLPNTTSNQWRFRTTSDDGSFLWLGSDAIDVDTSLNTSNAIVNNGGVHSQATQTSGNNSLTAGILYPIAIVAGNSTGPGTLTVQWRSNARSAWASTGQGLFFYDPYAPNGFNHE